MKKGIKGASIIEVVVASTIFLTIFTISLTSLVSITRHQPNTNEVLIAHNKVAHIARSYAKRDNGEYSYKIGRNKCHIIVAQYKQYTHIRYITITINHPLHCDIYRFLIENESYKTEK